MKKIDECYFDEKYDTILERLNAYVADVDIEKIIREVVCEIGYKSEDDYFDGNTCNFWGDRDFWAPEVHLYNGKYYLFGSCRSETQLKATHILFDPEYRLLLLKVF